MQFASQGLRFVTRKAPNVASHNHSRVVNTSRSIHIPSFVRAHARISPTSATQKLFSQSRNLFSRFFAHLTAPGLRTPYPPSFTSPTHPKVSATIRQGFSLPVRTALSRPAQQFFLPRAPAVPRRITDVGLGTARNFSTGRPVFQHLIENVPIAGRAFYEVDWEMKAAKEREMSMHKIRCSNPKKEIESKEMAKPKAEARILKDKAASNVIEDVDAELERYFPTPALPQVTTCLLIPLATTPTTRLPLPPDTADHATLLPLQALSSLHASHELHSLRVSALFSRLDAGKVWERGVQCSAYSHIAGSEGVCTVLKVEFVGWTKAEVRGVIGESGTGWCALEETKTGTVAPGRLSDIEEDEDSLSETSSICSGTSAEWDSSPLKMESVADGVDPAQLFVLPMLDISPSFLDSPPLSRSPSRSSSDLGLFSPMGTDFDPWTEVEVLSPSSSSSSLADDEGPIQIQPASLDGWFGLSSHFSRRDEVQEPRDGIFF